MARYSQETNFVRVFPEATNIAGNRKHADYHAVIMNNVGHFLQLEKPAEFNAKLRAVLATWKK